jgi:hypothetical protein
MSKDRTAERQRIIEAREMMLQLKAKRVRAGFVKRTEKKRAETLKRWSKAIALREAGFSWREISAKCGSGSYQGVLYLRPDLRTLQVAA